MDLMFVGDATRSTNPPPEKRIFQFVTICLVDISKSNQLLQRAEQRALGCSNVVYSKIFDTKFFEYEIMNIF